MKSNNNQFTKLEPHSVFKKAIVKRDKDGCITYSYKKLINVCIHLHSIDEETAIEWVDFNILNIPGFKVKR